MSLGKPVLIEKRDISEVPRDPVLSNPDIINIRTIKKIEICVIICIINSVYFKFEYILNLNTIKLPLGFEPRSVDSKSTVITTRLWKLDCIIIEIQNNNSNN